MLSCNSFHEGRVMYCVISKYITVHLFDPVHCQVRSLKLLLGLRAMSSLPKYSHSYPLLPPLTSINFRFFDLIHSHSLRWRSK